jgi:predicted MFS family arabinose efflux permease
MGARLLLALSAASFMPAAGGYAAGLGGSERHGRALSMVIGGLTVAIIAGVPLGVLLGAAFGWRATFLGVGGMAAFSLVGILAWLPRQQPSAMASLGKRMALARRTDILTILAVTVLTVASTFTVYTYLGVFMHVVTGLDPRGLAVVLLGFGVASAIGTRVGGSATDLWGARTTVICGCGLVLSAYVALVLGATLQQASMAVLIPAILLWGFASWAVTTAQQARLVALAPDLAPIGLSINSSAIYLGSAVGASVGAIVIADDAVRMLGGVAACMSLAALLVVLLDSRRGHKRAGRAP